MKGKSIALALSVVLNVLLLVLFMRPDSDRYVFAQVSNSTGSYAGAAAPAGSSRDALWLADSKSGMLIVYDYRLGTDNQPVQFAQRRNLRQDLAERQVGRLMLVPLNYSSSRSVVCVIDTDSHKMAIYDYDVNNRELVPVQRNDLRVDFGTAETPPA